MAVARRGRRVEAALRRVGTRGISPPSKITPADTVKIDEVRDWLGVARRVGARGALLEGAVWPVLVVMQDVGREDVLEVTTAED